MSQLKNAIIAVTGAEGVGHSGIQNYAIVSEKTIWHRPGDICFGMGLSHVQKDGVAHLVVSNARHHSYFQARLTTQEGRDAANRLQTYLLRDGPFAYLRNKGRTIKEHLDTAVFDADKCLNRGGGLVNMELVAAGVMLRNVIEYSFHQKWVNIDTFFSQHKAYKRWQRLPMRVKLAAFYFFSFNKWKDTVAIGPHRGSSHSLITDQSRKDLVWFFSKKFTEGTHKLRSGDFSSYGRCLNREPNPVRHFDEVAVYCHTHQVVLGLDAYDDEVFGLPFEKFVEYMEAFHKEVLELEKK